MARKLATIQRITNLSPIPDADAIEVAQILGWKVVVKKGEFHVGSIVVYCEIDSLMPNNRPEFEFLKSSNYRIRTVKLRGQVSQGIAFPLDILPIDVKWHVEELERSRITLHD
jgi:RNA ligase (TIGR02306 family)